MSQRRIDIDQAEDVLKEMLASAGVDLAAADPPQLWSVFKEFCRTVEVETPDDMVLFSVGVFHFYGPEQFQLDFVRQFAHPEEDDEDEPIQLECEFRYEPVDELRRLGEWTRWSVEDASLDDFFAAVERHPFLEAASRHRALEVKISHFQV